jgi:hypothetical protein
MTAFWITTALILVAAALIFVGVKLNKLTKHL